MGPGGRALCRILRARTARHLEAGLESFLSLHFTHRCYLLIPDAGQELTSYLPVFENKKDFRRRVRRCVPTGDPWFTECPPRPGIRIIKHALSYQRWKKTEFFRNHGQSEHIHFGVSILIWTASGPRACITLVRGREDGDFGAEHLRCVDACYAEILAPAVASFLNLTSLETEIHALKAAYNQGRQCEVIVRRPDRVIAGTPSGLRVVQTWESGRETTNIGNDPVLPPRLASCCAQPEKGQEHERWKVHATPLSSPLRGESNYFVLRFSDKVQEDSGKVDLDTLGFGSREILRHLAAGKTNREIAQIRGISPATVRNQVGALLQRLGLRNRTELALAYYKAMAMA